MSEFKVTIEAIQWNGTKETFNKLVAFSNYKSVFSRLADGKNEITIHNSEGIMKAAVNDWIVKNENGEFFPCKIQFKTER